MFSNRDQRNGDEAVSPDRLIIAADALLETVSQSGNRGVGIDRDPARIGRLGLSVREVEEAARFLHRLGMVDFMDDPPQRPR
jgi:catechol-2,3-dioxygenase